MNRPNQGYGQVANFRGGAEGMLSTLGGSFDGYGFYLVKGKPALTYNLLTLEKFRREAETSRPKDARS